MIILRDELRRFMSSLRLVFDVVRIVDVSAAKQVALLENGDMIEEPYQCYAVWNKSRRCENCISAKAIARKSKVSKFEFAGNDIYNVIAMYIEVDGKPYSLEMVGKMTDESVLEAYGKAEFINTIEKLNAQMYTDAFTGVYNRRYYEDQLAVLPGMGSVALVSVENIKEMCDTYGSQCADTVMEVMVRAVRSCVRTADPIVRMDSGELLVILQGIPVRYYSTKLEDIRTAVSAALGRECPDFCARTHVSGAQGSGVLAELVSAAKRQAG